jgi:hypothetical protein
MWKDPIVEEIHAVRAEIARRFNYDLRAIVADLRTRQEANADRVVTKEELDRRRAELERQELERDEAA